MKMNLTQIILMLTLTSCGSVSASSWKPSGVSYAKQVWRFCDKQKDSLDLYGRGYCYVAKECKKVVFIKKCRPKQLFCAYGDHECMKEYGLFDKVLSPR